MKRLAPIVPYVALVLIGMAVYYTVVGFDFVSYDDPIYVSRNIHVLSGVNAENLGWGWSTTRNGQWHPLVWWSYQLDAHLFDSAAQGFHFTNLVCHLLGTCLLFASLRLMRLGTGCSFLVAALYCVHPLHVESVAWISERKGVLSSLFWFAGMLAYAWYVRRPSWLRMTAVFLAMILGMMSKQMLVSFPLAMLLLDIWPLRRLQFLAVPEVSTAAAKHKQPSASPMATPVAIPLRWAILEKLPLFGLSLLFCWIAFSTQAQEGATNTIEQTSLAIRMLNVPGTYAFTLLHALWPLNLTIIYLPPQNLAERALIGVALLLLLTYLAWRYRRAVPAALVGWLWFLVCLFPLSGIVPLGSQWTADRYTDIPLIGIYLAVVSMVTLAARYFAVPASFSRGIAAVGLLVLSVLSIRQIATWENGVTLMRHAIAVNPENHIARTNLASDLIEQRDYKAAREQLENAVQFGPDNLQARNNLGLVLFKQGLKDQAIEHFRFVIARDPHFAEGFLNLGNAVLDTHPEKALEHFREAVRLNPEYAEAHNNLGAMLAKSDPAAAKQHYERSLEIWPGNADAHCNLANLYARNGKWNNALGHYEKALTIEANHATARRNMQIVLQSQRNASRSNRHQP